MFYKPRKRNTVPLVSEKRSEILEKLVQRDGKLFLVRFIVVERKGKLIGKIISCEAIETLSGETVSKEKKCLPVCSEKQSAPASKVVFRKIVSPFSTLEFFMSQPTRAPAF